ncbi:DUF6319 family protein [Nocardia macrotermitis]|uniref:Translation initiation factor n=1 Tax=Nocardia macrotermitis TaxID=2585198 RepID=A0A7K0DBF1_9NOCA|nr:DUF6319 family protein [Nocardia macrotermitis]MQY22851.1 hypothetical protein [Nocardia macrotermitis]
MSSRRTKPQPLSDTEIRQIAADLAADRPPMVWFTSEAVGVPEGRSGKVLALGDPADGDFLQVRPTGSKDVLSFSPTEVTLTKPARRTAPATVAKPRKDTPVSMPSSVTPSPQPPSPAPESPAPAQPAPAASKPAPAKPAAPESDESVKTAAKQPARPAKAAPARKAKPAEVTVTLSGTAEGEWTVDVVNGKKRTVRGLTVAGSSVAQAAKLLHPEVAEVVDSVLESVRNSQRVKVEQLQSELEQARRLLDELSG